MTLNELRYILAVARERHFGRAAESCHVSQPSLSVAVKKLEDELQVKIFERRSNEVTLTPTGAAIIDEAEHILDRCDKLREMEVEGTDDNELMTDFRQLLAKNSPLDAPKLTADFVKEHPGSRVGVYLVSTYLVRNDRPDYAEARRLINLMRKEQPRNGHLILLAKQLAPYETVRIGQPLPRFKALTLSGRTFTQQDFRSGEGVVIVWASWSYRSLGCLRAVQEAKRQHPDLQVLTICLDATRKDCEKLLRQFDVTLPTVCDGRMLDSPLLANLSLHDLPDNILVENGRVKQRSLSDEELRKRFLETNHSY